MLRYHPALRNVNASIDTLIPLSQDSRDKTNGVQPIPTIQGEANPDKYERLTLCVWQPEVDLEIVLRGERQTKCKYQIGLHAQGCSGMVSQKLSDGLLRLGASCRRAHDLLYVLCRINATVGDVP